MKMIKNVVGNIPVLYSLRLLKLQLYCFFPLQSSGTFFRVNSKVIRSMQRPHVVFSFNSVLQCFKFHILNSILFQTVLVVIKHMKLNQLIYILSTKDFYELP